MITLPHEEYTFEDLERKPREDSSDMLEYVYEAVGAYADLFDPLAWLQSFSSRENTATGLTDAYNWLISYAPLTPALGLTGTDDVIANDPYCAWQINVSKLGQERIKANYLQGYQESHPVFALTYSPIVRKRSGDDDHQARMMEPHHWALFVKAVQMQAWRETADKQVREGLEVNPETYEDCRAGARGAIGTLASAYPRLGEPIAGAGGFTILSSTARRATKLWEQSIKSAADAFTAFHYG